MRLVVLGSGSGGNSVAVSAAGVTLLLDAGFGPRTLMQRCEAAGIEPDSIIGIVLTHEHGDHARGAKGIARRVRCPVFGSRGTLAALAPKIGSLPCVRLPNHRTTAVGPFRVAACPTTHDAAEPLAVTVTGPNRRAKVGLAYDLGRPTAAVRHMLRDATCLLVEANHDEVMLRTSEYPPVVRDRIAGSRGHLSNRAAGELLAELCHRRLESVVLVHLSETCNHPEVAAAEVQRHLHAAGYRGALMVAKQHEPTDAVRVAADPVQLELGVGS